MKFKMFYFSSIQGQATIEETINHWLAEHHNIEIKHFSQTPTPSPIETKGFAISIFYEVR